MKIRPKFDSNLFHTKITYKVKSKKISIGTTIIDAVIICGAFVDVYAVGVCGSDIGGNIVCDIFDETIIAVTSITS